MKIILIAVACLALTGCPWRQLGYRAPRYAIEPIPDPWNDPRTIVTAGPSLIDKTAPLQISHVILQLPPSTTTRTLEINIEDQK